MQKNVDTLHLKHSLKRYKSGMRFGEATAIAEHTGLHQTTVSRILNGQFKGPNSSVAKVCKYAKISINDEASLGSYDRVTQELSEVWDGSQAMEDLLVGILRSLKNYQS